MNQWRRKISVVIAAVLMLQIVITGLIGEAKTVEAAPGGPEVLATYPANSADNVPEGTSLTMTFDESVQRAASSTGAAVYIVRVSDNVAVETFQTSSSSRISIDSGGRLVRITPSSGTLVAGQSYYVRIDAGAFTNASRTTNYAGISDGTKWMFGVRAANTTTPEVASMSPLTDAGNPVSVPVEKLELTFNRAVFVSQGTITITNNSLANDVQTIDVQSTSVVGGNSDKITITPPTPLKPNASYTVTVPAGAFKDQWGNSSKAISGNQWRFVTAAAPLNIVSLTPSGVINKVPVNTQLVATFDRAVRAGTGSIVIRKIADNALVQSFNVAQANNNVVIAGQTLTITPATLQAGTGYYVQIDAGALVLDADATTKFQGISDASTWRFMTIGTLETNAPKVTELKPTNGGLQGALRPQLEMTFDKPVYPAGGTISIHNRQTNALVESFRSDDSKVSGGGTTKIVLKPSANFINNASYYIVISNGAFNDASGNSYAGTSGNSGWWFRVTNDTTAPTLVTLSPANNSSGVQLGSTLSATFNKDIQLTSVNNGNMNIRQIGGTGTVVPVQAVLDTKDKRKVNIILPTSGISGNASYYVEIPAGLVQDMAGNDYEGILNQYAWTFKTGQDTTLPQLSTAAMTGGSRIVLTYNKVLDERSVPSTANFYVTVNEVARNVTKVEVSGSTVTITLQSGVVLGQAVKVSYSKGSSPIQDLSGNAAVNLSAREVTNSTSTTYPRPTSGTVYGSSVTLTFNESLASVSTSGYGQFSVYVGGSYRSVTAVSGSGTTLYLTLSSAVTDGQSVAVSYSPGSYPLRDNAGNAVQSFSSFYVRNGLDTSPPVLQSVAAGGTKIILNYNEGLNPGSVPLANHFTVMVNNAVRAVTAVEVFNSQVQLTISSGVTDGQSVLVSYSPGYPPLTDLSGNNAYAFTGMPASSVSSGQIGVGSLVSATLSGQNVLLVFAQSLSTANVPATGQFYVKINGAFSTVTGVSISGSTVTLPLLRPINTGETVTVSYLASGTQQLRTLNGEAIQTFTDYPVQTQGSWGGNLPADFEALDGGGLNIKVSSAMASSDVASSGKSVNRYTISADRLAAAYNAVLTGSAQLPRVQFTVPDTQGAAIVSLPVAELEAARKKIGNATFVLKHKTVSYEIPLAALDFNEIVRLIGASVISGNLIIEIDAGAAPSNSNLITAVSRNRGQLMSSPINFSVYATNGTIKQEIKSFSSYVTRTIFSPVKFEPSKTATVWLDPETDVLSYVPTRVVNGTGSTVTFKRKGNSSYAVISGNAAFTDIAKHWASKDIANLASKFIIEGRAAGKFEPEKQVTRGEFAMFIARGLGLSGDKQAAAKFSDVTASTQYAAYIGAATNAGIVQGNTDGSFKPNNFITRQEMAAMMIRAASAADVKIVLAGTSAATLNKYKDRSAVASWAQDDVARAIESGIINGMTKTTIGPKSDATRAQAAVMVKRLLVYIEFLDA
ncbi:hypothetical protein EBB07_06570 [Paenibacillaceae bacterium]|nr:hypothetical protein EBB07_06570 [Paenibacillaceae bacterium]